MGEKKVIFKLPEELVQKLDEYAEQECKGNRTMAVYQILKQFLEKREKK
ncbi:MAG: hypothetical protein QXO67_02755 [Candidatus Bathyarchaeia archaeon]